MSVCHKVLPLRLKKWQVVPLEHLSTFRAARQHIQIQDILQRLVSEKSARKVHMLCLPVCAKIAHILRMFAMNDSSLGFVEGCFQAGGGLFLNTTQPAQEREKRMQIDTVLWGGCNANIDAHHADESTLTDCPRHRWREQVRRMPRRNVKDCTITN